MNKEKTVIIILTSVIIITAVIIYCIIFQKPQMQTLTEQKQELYKDISPKDYGYDITEDFEFEDNGQKIKITDISTSVKERPSFLAEKAKKIKAAI